MMTYEERRRRINSVRNLKRAVFAKWLDNTWQKLNAYNTLFEPPATIREANRVRADRLFAESCEAHEMYEQLDKIEDRLYAMPSKGTIESFNGQKDVIVYDGMLPNGKRTSVDEAAALKMLNDYYAEATA